MSNAKRPAFPAEGRATAIGSLPHQDPQAACALVREHLLDIPAWPQLPRRSPLEGMYLQFSEGFPGFVCHGERCYVDRAQDLATPLERLYGAFLEEAPQRYPLRPEYAAGFFAFVHSPPPHPVAVKGQLTGPISWGLGVTDQNRRPVLYDEILADALGKLLRLKAIWQERALSALAPHTIIFVDEPYLASAGSALVALSRERITALLEEVLGGLKGTRGIHCCGNTDWPTLLATSAHIISFDAYEYGPNVALFPTEVAAFLHRGGVLAWGIVPSQEAPLAQESTPSLLGRLEALMEHMRVKGIPFPLLVRQSLITPSCGLGSLTVASAQRALALTAEVSREFRRKYGLEV